MNHNVVETVIMIYKDTFQKCTAYVFNTKLFIEVTFSLSRYSLYRVINHPITI